MLWTNIKTNNRITPYVKVGLGVAKAKIVEEYNSSYHSNLEFGNWSFCYGYGGGVELDINNQFGIALFVESTILMRDLTENDEYGYEITLLAPYGYALYGIRFIWRI